MTDSRRHPVPTTSSTAPPPSRRCSPSTPAATTSKAASWPRRSTPLRDAGLLAAGVPTELGGLGATTARAGRAAARAGPPLRLDRAGDLDAPARRVLHRLALPARPARRRGDPAPRRRRRDRARVHRRRRLDAPARRGRQGRRRLPGLGPQGVRQPVDGRHRDVDDVRLRRPGARACGCSTWPCPFASDGVTRARQLGHPRHARHRQQRHRARGRLRARRAGAGQPSVRRHRPAAAGDRQHRVPDHLRRLPRRRRGGLRGRGRVRCAGAADDPTSSARSA